MATNVFINNNQPPPPTTLIAVQSNQWSTGICDCFDDLNVCCFAYCCFPCFTCKTTSDFGECFYLPLVDILCTTVQMTSVPSCAAPVSMSMRVGVRTRYGIQGDMTSDCVYTTLCNICSWCQIAREIKRRSQKVSVMTAQPVYMGGQQFVMTTQPGAITSQPVISAVPQVVLSP